MIRITRCLQATQQRFQALPVPAPTLQPPRGRLLLPWQFESVLSLLPVCLWFMYLTFQVPTW